MYHSNLVWAGMAAHVVEMPGPEMSVIILNTNKSETHELLYLSEKWKTNSDFYLVRMVRHSIILPRVKNTMREMAIYK